MAKSEENQKKAVVAPVEKQEESTATEKAEPVVDIQLAAKVATREAYRKNVAPNTNKEAVVQRVK